ncbi:MAG: hypothetical protein LBE22_07715 [Azoarcus sp.]|jgi:hypothetical protein|nr:hypothetical protein [Azoarcus sp.]
MKNITTGLVLSALLLSGGCSQDWCEDSEMAFVMSQNFVKKRLKSPHSAKFPHQATTLYKGECTHVVSAYVDSQNSFGAMLRTLYIAELQYSSSDSRWKLKDIQMGPAPESSN